MTSNFVNAAIQPVAVPPFPVKFASNVSSGSEIAIHVNKITHRWSIDNFHSLYFNEYTNTEPPNKMLSSKIFGDGQLQFRIQLNPYSLTRPKNVGAQEANEPKKEQCISVYLVKESGGELEDSGKEETWFRLKCWIHGGSGGKRAVKILEKCAFKDNKAWGWPNFLHRAVILFTNNGLLEENNKLNLCCEITYLSSVQVEPATGPLLDRLGADLADFYKKDVLHDVTLVFGDTEVKAHKAILSARSPVFAAMFEHDTVEQQENRVTISDVDEKAGKVMLEYIYTGMVSEMEGIEEKVMQVADKYNLDELKCICENKLIKAISSVNVCELIVLADLHSASNLKAAALEFLRRNTQDTVEALFKFEHTELVVETLRDLTRKRQSMDTENSGPNRKRSKMSNEEVIEIS